MLTLVLELLIPLILIIPCINSKLNVCESGSGSTSGSNADDWASDFTSSDCAIFEWGLEGFDWQIVR